ERVDGTLRRAGRGQRPRIAHCSVHRQPPARRRRRLTAGHDPRRSAPRAARARAWSVRLPEGRRARRRVGERAPARSTLL
ncbi:MAG: hypothetical protein AVDCRST_MAG85-1869, partial [uncultured Solirubrobacteraceae bacterium]